MLNKSHQRILIAISLGYMLIALGTMGVSYSVVSAMQRLHEISAKLYAEPFKISRVAMRISDTAALMRIGMLELALASSAEQVNAIEEKLLKLDQSMEPDLGILHQGILDDPIQIDAVVSNLNHWRRVRAEIIGTARAGEQRSIATLVYANGKGARAYTRVRFSLEQIVRYAEDRAASLAEAANNEARSAIESTYSRLSMLLIFIGVVAVLMGRRARQFLLAEQRNVQEIAESNEKHNAFYDAALDAIVMVDARGVIVDWRGQASRIFGWSASEALGKTLHETIIPAQHRDAHLKGMARFLATGEKKILNTRVEINALHRDGHEFPVELTVSCVKTHDGYEFNAFLRDVTEKKAADHLIWRQANYDALTNLPNRHLFQENLGQEIKKAIRNNRAVALLLVDLDHFNQVNDALGQHIGDALLQQTAQRITACVRDVDGVSRLNGDEFAVILGELPEDSVAAAVVANILDALKKPFQLGSETVYTSASIGVTLYPADASSVASMAKNADLALHAAKSDGRNCTRYFNASMEAAVKMRKELGDDLRVALEANQLHVFYQPIVDLSNGKIGKAEALIRWNHPTRGAISPATFIPLAEESGMIIEIGEWVFHQAAAQCLKLRQRGHTDFSISVNVSPVQFHAKSTRHGPWSEYLQTIDLPGQGIVAEITEGLLVNTGNAMVREKMRALQESGIQISLDDFGTGYSSLSYLNQLDIDFLKIDQSFVRKLGAGSSELALCKSIIVMGHELGMKVIAEGVETEIQRDFLAAAGCDFGQGYLWSRPVPSVEFEKLL